MDAHAHIDPAASARHSPSSGDGEMPPGQGAERKDHYAIPTGFLSRHPRHVSVTRCLCDGADALFLSLAGSSPGHAQQPATDTHVTDGGESTVKIVINCRWQEPPS